VTTQKYFAVAFIDGVGLSALKGPGRERRVRLLAVRRDVVPGQRAHAGEQAKDADERPQVRRGRGTLPTSGSDGQLLV